MRWSPWLREDIDVLEKANTERHAYERLQQLDLTTLEESVQLSYPAQVLEGDTVEVLCRASKYSHSGHQFTWYRQTGARLVKINDIANFTLKIFSANGWLSL